VQQLGTGVSGHLRDDISVESLVNALRECLQPKITTRTHEVAGRMELHGARIAEERLASEFS